MFTTDRCEAFEISLLDSRNCASHIARVLFSVKARNKEMVRQYFTNRREQIDSDASLENVAQGPSGKTCPDKVRIRMDGQKDDFRGATRFPQLFDSFDAIDHGHGDVRQDYVRLEAQTTVN